MSDVMMQLDNFQFSVSTAAYQELRRTVEYRWARLERIAHRPSLQFVGVGNDEIELRGAILPAFRGGIHQLDVLRLYAQKGQSQTLTTGRGENWGPWCVLSIGDEQSTMSFQGTPLRIEFSLRLSYYGPDDESNGANGYVSSTWYKLLSKQGTSLITPPEPLATMPSTVPPVSTAQLASLSTALQSAKIPPQQAANTLTTAVQRVRLLSAQTVDVAKALASASMTISELQRGIAKDPVGTLTRLLSSGLSQSAVAHIFGADIASDLLRIGSAVQVGTRSQQTVRNLLVAAGRSIA